MRLRKPAIPAPKKAVVTVVFGRVPRLGRKRPNFKAFNLRHFPGGSPWWSEDPEVVQALKTWGAVAAVYVVDGTRLVPFVPKYDDTFIPVSYYRDAWTANYAECEADHVRKTKRHINYLPVLHASLASWGDAVLIKRRGEIVQQIEGQTN